MARPYTVFIVLSSGVVCSVFDTEDAANSCAEHIKEAYKRTGTSAPRIEVVEEKVYYSAEAANAAQ